MPVPRRIERVNDGDVLKMEVIQDDLWLCDDCTLYAVNGDLSGIDYSFSGKEAEKRVREVTKGVNALGPNLVPISMPTKTKASRSSRARDATVAGRVSTVAVTVSRSSASRRRNARAAKPRSLRR